MSSALRPIHRLALALALVGPGAPLRADESDTEKPLAPPPWADREGGADGPLIHLPPVGNQRDSYTCVSWAVRTVAAFHRHRLERGTGAEPRALSPEEWSREFAPSVAYLFNQEARRARCEDYLATKERGETTKPDLCLDTGDFTNAGTSPNVNPMLTGLTSMGAPTERSAPFTTNAAAVPTEAQRAEAGRHRCCWQAALGTGALKILSGDEITVAALRSALVRGPLIAMMNVFTDFACTHESVYRPNRSTTEPAQRRGRHAIVIVSHRKSAESGDPEFLFMNSWGEDWRDHGMVWIPFAAFGQHPNNEGNRVIMEVYLPDPPAAPPVGPPPGRSPCEPCAKAVESPPEFYFGPPRLASEAWRDDGLEVPCSEVPVLRIPAPSDPTTPDHEKPAAPPPQVIPEHIAVRRQDRFAHTFKAPPIPLIPALFGSKIQYFVGPLDAARKSPRGRPDEVLKPIDPTLGYRFRFVGLGGDERGDPDLGADPEAIGAWQDRARFEVTDAKQLGKEPILVRIEVRYPGDDDRGPPRFLREYVLNPEP